MACEPLTEITRPRGASAPTADGRRVAVRGQIVDGHDWATSEGRSFAQNPKPAIKTPGAAAKRSVQRKISSDTCFQCGICASVCSGVKKRTRKWPSAGFRVGTAAGTAGCAVM